MVAHQSVRVEGLNPSADLGGKSQLESLNIKLMTKFRNKTLV